MQTLNKHMNKKDLDNKINRFLYHVWLLNEQYNSIMSTSCKRGGDLNLQEIKAVGFLGRHGKCKMKELADYLALAVSTTTSLADSLEAKNVVKRERSQEDRRVIMLQLTEEGIEEYNNTLHAYREFCKSVLEELDEKEQDRLIEIFDKVKNIYSIES